MFLFFCKHVFIATCLFYAKSTFTFSLSDFELDIGDWKVYKWERLYYDSEEAEDFSVDAPSFQKNPGDQNEVKMIIEQFPSTFYRQLMSYIVGWFDTYGTHL